MPKKLSYTINFNLDKPSLESKHAYIVMIVRHSGKRLKYSIGNQVLIEGNPKKVTEKRNGNWLLIKQRRFVSASNPDKGGVNKRIEQLIGIIDTYFAEVDVVDLKQLRNELDYKLGKKERPDDMSNSPYLLDFAESYINKVVSSPNAKRGTWKKFITVKSHIENFSNEKGSHLTFDEIDFNFKEDFEAWLYEEPRCHSANNASKIFEVLKQFMSESYKRKMHKSIYFTMNGFGVKRVKTTNKVSLNFEELGKLRNLKDLSQREQRVADLMVIGCYTGLRFCDWHKINKDNIVRGRKGDMYLEIFTQKTTKMVKIPLMIELEELLVKYNYDIPSMSLTEFNRIIKTVVKKILKGKKVSRVFSKAGVTQSERVNKYTLISSHCARRSFATNFYESGVSPAILRMITGHSTEKQFFEYLDLDLDKAVEKFSDFNKSRSILKAI